jgi:2-hydroxycyclohexanecarboxyl-CoA dehydrogenase
VGTDSRGWTMKPFWETEPDEWTSFVNVNLYGVLNVCRHALPIMIAQNEGGRLITIVSDAARTGEPKLEVYAAAKAGAAGFTRSIAKSVSRYNITANSIALGTMWSEGYAAMQPEQLAERMRPYLIRRPGQPDEAAALVAFLASPDAAWITGQTYPLNGGISTS